jgi:hypothetical protein
LDGWSEAELNNRFFGFYRPTLEGEKGFNFTGHHELMIPLLAAGLVDRLAEV